MDREIFRRNRRFLPGDSLPSAKSPRLNRSKLLWTTAREYSWIDDETGHSCKLCGHFHPQSQVSGKFDFAWATLEASVHQGCKTCKTILDGIRHFEYNWKDSTSIARISIHLRSWDWITCSVDFEDERPLLRLEFKKSGM